MRDCATFWNKNDPGILTLSFSLCPIQPISNVFRISVPKKKKEKKNQVNNQLQGKNSNWAVWPSPFKSANT